MMAKIKMDDVRKVLCKGLEYAFYGVTTVLSIKSMTYTPEITRNKYNTTYSDVISAVLNSGMYTSCRETVIAKIPKHADPELYKAIIDIVNSSMFSDSKVKTIIEIIEKES